MGMIGIGLGLTFGQRAFTPLSLPGLALWLDAGQIPDLVDGDPVGTWSDLSGLGNHATQATAAKKPLLKMAIVNGRPVVRFDGVDDLIATAAFLAALSQPYTVIVVAKQSNNTGAQVLFDNEAAGASSLYVTGVTSYNLNAGSDVAGGTPNTSWHVFSSLLSGASSQTWRDGTTILSGNAGAGTKTGITLGGGRAGGSFLTGDMSEVIACAGALSTSDRQRFERYAGAKYGIVVA